MASMPRFTPEHWRTLEAVFVAAGFRFARQEGSHRSYLREGVARPVVIPVYREVSMFIIRNNLKTAGLSRDEYFRLLAQVK
jgi:predicted RNA binding protein YcfA (HicA-like mRNA interferase family)